MSSSPPTARCPRRPPALSCAVAVCLVSATLLPLAFAPGRVEAVIGHLVISEVVTGAASASDELIELYNPSAEALPLEGLELVYVTASGATITRRAAWSLGAEPLPPGAHLLVANELGAFAPIADALYGSGMAATGGSVALRIQGAASAIDAVGWGTATSSWLEGTPAAAPAAGASLERRPGGDAGSNTDTDDNDADFVVRSVPDPQNLASPPVPAVSPSPTPSATADPTPSATADPTPSATADPAPSATADPAPSATADPAPSAGATPSLPPPSGSPPPTPDLVAAARALPDGTPATIQGTALTASDFADGGGYVADDTGGIAVLLDGGSFARGDLVLVAGTIDDRFAQRTLRAPTAIVVPGGAAVLSEARVTGAIDESAEGRLVILSGIIDGGSTALTGGVAFDVDDGSGIARVVVGWATGIDTAAWSDGRQVVVTGVVGQRDSSGTGLAGYRVQPRDPADVELLPAPTPSPSPSPSASGDPTPTPSATGTPAEVSTIADARAAAKGASLTVRGLVTLASGTIEAGSAVIQDATGAILLRLGDEAGEVALGQLVEVDAVRSTKSGMESLRVSDAPRRVGIAPEPAPRQLHTGDAGEPHEAQLVVARGALVASARRASSGSVSFEIDDGSGPLRVTLGASLAADDEQLQRGAWVEVTGPLGQETTGSQPLRGYRIWPRSAGEVRILAAATNADDDDNDDDDDDDGNDGDDDRDDRGASGGGGSAAADSLGAIGPGPLGELRVGATLVAAGWHEAGLAGLLWDGNILVGIASGSAAVLDGALGERRLPISIELGHLAIAGTDPRLGITVVTLGSGPGDVVVGTAPTKPPLARLPGRRASPAWVSVVGRLSADRLRVGGASVRVEELCAMGSSITTGSVSVTGVALPDRSRIVAPCGGLQRAPSLELALAAARSSGPPAAHRASASRASEVAASTDGPRGLAAGLLGAGIGVLLLATLARGRLDGPRTSSDVRPAPVADGDASGGARRLTLVSVPRKHG